MPVRFRCSYCNQLLGISRRKIGTPVKCPTCQGQVVVPPHDTEERAVPAAPQPLIAPERQFEQSDFLQMLEQPVAAHTAGDRPILQSRLPDLPLSAPANDLQIDVEPMAAPLPATGWMVLTPIKLTVLVVVMIMALAVAFAAGVLVGRAMGAWVPKGSVIDESAE
jgi:hypothetical protein